MLSLGLLLLVSGLYAPFNSQLPPAERRSQLMACLLFSTPLLVGGIWLRGTARRAQMQRDRDRLQTIFFQLVQADRGRLTPLGFAMAADIPLAVAKRYLDAQAIELSANFEPQDDGTVIYCFPISGLPTLTATPPSFSPPFSQRDRLDVVIDAIPGHAKIAAIKAMRTATGLGLKDAKDIVETTPRLFRNLIPQPKWDEFHQQMAAIGVQVQLGSHLSAEAVRTAPSSIAPPSSHDRVDILMGAIPPDVKIRAIKIMRDVTGLGLKEAKDVVETAPHWFRDLIPRAKWDDFHQQMTEIGVQVQLDSSELR